jgi:RHS repeat-associated protein
MVAINKILLPECTGEGCGGDTDVCTDSRIHRRNAESRVPATRNHLRAVAFGRWLTRDPIGYRGGINLYGYVDSSPVGNVDASGEHKGDQWYGYNNKTLQRWAHDQKTDGRPDFTKDEIKELYKVWLAQGKPDGEGHRTENPKKNPECDNENEGNPDQGEEPKQITKAAGNLAKGAVAVGTGFTAAEVAADIPESLAVVVVVA